MNKAKDANEEVDKRDDDEANWTIKMHRNWLTVPPCDRTRIDKIAY